MRILHFISAPAAGGAEIYVKDLAKSLVAMGHDVHIGFLSSAKRVNRSTSFEDAFLSELEAAGVKYFFTSDDARKKPWQGIAKVRRYIKQNGIDVYHSHLFYGVVFGGFSRVPRIYTHHTNTPNYNKANWTLINSFVDEVVGISQICFNNIQSVLWKPSRVIFNGVNPEKFKGLQRERTPSDHFSFISVGRISEPKNYSLLVESVGLLPAEIREKCVFSIAGEGSEELTEALKSKIRALGIGNTVRLLGNINDIPQEMLKHDVFLMTSAYEGLPIALIEASISGLPCLVTNVGGCKEVIETCSNGELVLDLEPSSVAAKIEFFVKNPDLVHKYSVASLENARKFFIDVASQKHIEMYVEKSDRK